MIGVKSVYKSGLGNFRLQPRKASHRWKTLDYLTIKERAVCLQIYRVAIFSVLINP